MTDAEMNAIRAREELRAKCDQLQQVSDSLFRENDQLIEERDRLQAEAAAMHEAINDLLGSQHVIKSMVGTMLRWKEQPGVDFTSEAKLLIEHVERWHKAIVFARSSNAGTALLERVKKLEAVADAVRSFGTVEVPQQIYDALAALDGAKP